MLKTIGRGVVAAAAVSVVFLTAGCGGAGEPAADAEVGAPADGELTAVTVSIPPSSFAAPMYLGVSEGIFEDAGFEVTLKPGTSMAEMMPLLMNGQAQYIFADLHNTILAQTEGMPIAVGAPIAVNAQDEPKQGFANLMVAEDSGIKELKDLEGKKIGTNSIDGQAQLDNTTYLESKGVDTSNIEWIAVPTQQAVAGLKQGQYDAITIAEPGGTLAMAEGGVRMIGSADAAMPSAPMFVLAAQTSYIEGDKEAAKRFQEAVTEANKLANTDREKVNASLATFMKIPPELLAKTVLPTFAEAPFRPADSEQVVDRLKDHGILADDVTPDLAALYPLQ
ncbi:ABC transporter substrate-binding protein [Arthrobacter sulfonylureivorans]|uniref:ABC transporter substrate-binding protein n=1 Tax=Arthrobacter sulfonylureivorans TaxID=2486855 RepID=A0ABY3W703_9MICC|nr:ABC transporter substrate-binding protein [Arthrobacter sulfonylureivorans]UNK46063.1 ABC transporter substrate-binding protein [Arthrobacter sulfonylureivorans]